MASVVLSFGGREIKTYQLAKPATVVGRDAAVDIVVDNLGVSRSHCQFLRRGTAFVLQDMNSSNGTYVNGQKVAEHYLNHGDQIVVGKYTLTFKNEAQSAADVHQKVVPDSLNTYVMDSDKIKQRLEEMRRVQESGVAPAPAAPATAVPAAPAAAVPAVPAAAPLAAAHPEHPAVSPQADRAEHHTKIIMGGGGHAGPPPATIRKYLYVSLAVNIILAVALCILVLYYNKVFG